MCVGESYGYLVCSPESTHNWSDLHEYSSHAPERPHCHKEIITIYYSVSDSAKNQLFFFPFTTVHGCESRSQIRGASLPGNGFFLIDFFPPQLFILDRFSMYVFVFRMHPVSITSVSGK